MSSIGLYHDSPEISQKPESGRDKPNHDCEGRIVWPDVLRTVAVAAVIMLHAAAVGFDGRFGARTVSWQVCNLYDSLVRFSVPVFVMVSGMFLLNPEREYDLKKLYLSKILRIATAFLFWASFYLMVVLIVTSVQGKPSSGEYGYLYIIMQEAAGGHYHLWFLFMIAGLYMVTPFSFCMPVG